MLPNRSQNGPKSIPERPWGALGRSWGALGRSWTLLGRSGALLGSWALSGRPWTSKASPRPPIWDQNGSKNATQNRTKKPLKNRRRFGSFLDAFLVNFGPKTAPKFVKIPSENATKRKTSEMRKILQILVRKPYFSSSRESFLRPKRL